jgi:sugar phosphate isomerase/epimerase
MLRFAMCNEAFGETPLPEVCRVLRGAGYTGIEIAPFTLDTAPDTISAGRRKEMRCTIEDSGLDFVGLHWLLAGPPGLHVTTPDDLVRMRSWDYIHRLVDLSADLADGPSVMVFGSPKQRATTGGSSPEAAVERFVDGLRSVAPHAESRAVTILVEALPSDQCDIIRTLAEAADVVHQMNSPAVQTMFDTHNAADETEPHPQLIERYLPLIRHVHINEMDGRHPGTGDYDFRSILQILERLGYNGWVSLEAFDFTPGGPAIARETLTYLRSLI